MGTAHKPEPFRSKEPVSLHYDTIFPMNGWTSIDVERVFLCIGYP